MRFPKSVAVRTMRFDIHTPWSISEMGHCNESSRQSGLQCKAILSERPDPTAQSSSEAWWVKSQSIKPGAKKEGDCCDALGEMHHGPRHLFNIRHVQCREPRRSEVALSAEAIRVVQETVN